MNTILKKVALPALTLFTILITLSYDGRLIPSAIADDSGEEKVYYYLTDHLGDIDTVTDENGTVVERKDYLPFGDERLTVGDADEDYGYNGKEMDDESGLNYYGARYYDSKLARFTQNDPLVMNQSAKPLTSVLENPQALNGYSYVLNNPLKYVDENGMYGSDVHYTLTYYLSIQAGLDTTAATEVAFFDDRVDTNQSTAPRGDLVSVEGWERTIRNITNGTTDKYHFQNTENSYNNLIDAINSGDTRKFGAALHTYQDSYSHDGLNEVSHSLLTLFGWSGAEKTDPDNTASNLGKSLIMARRSFMAIREINKKSLSLDDDGMKAYNTESIKIWSSVSKDVKTYLSAKIKNTSKVNDKGSSTKNTKK